MELAAVSAHPQQARHTLSANTPAGAAIPAIGGLRIHANAAAAFAVESACVVARSTALDALRDVDTDPAAADIISAAAATAPGRLTIASLT